MTESYHIKILKCLFPYYCEYIFYTSMIYFVIGKHLQITDGRLYHRGHAMILRGHLGSHLGHLNGLVVSWHVVDTDMLVDSTDIELFVIQSALCCKKLDRILIDVANTTSDLF